MSETTTTTRRIDNPEWLAHVRRDLDGADWDAHPRAMTRVQAIEGHLDAILAELGHPRTSHACPDCGLVHQP